MVFSEFLYSAFPWLKLSPELHLNMFICRAAESMSWLGSVGLNGQLDC